MIRRTIRRKALVQARGSLRGTLLNGLATAGAVGHVWLENVAAPCESEGESPA